MPKLADVTEINPRLDRSELNDLSEVISFVPMAYVSDVLGAITSEEHRALGDVIKGFTTFKDRDVLVAKITPCFENGKIAHARIDKRLGFGSTEFHVVRPLAEKLDDRYLYHFLRQPIVREDGKLRMTGSGGQKRVPKTFIEELDIPLPPLPEQRRIAAILDKADALRAKRREAIAKLDQLLQSVFLEMFGDPVTNPKGWPIENLGELIEFSTGKLDSNAAEENGEYPFFTCSRTPSRINTYAFDCEALLLAGNNAAGQYWVKHYVGKFNAYQRTYILRVKNGLCDYTYMKQVIQSRLLDLQRMSKGSSTKYLTLGILKSILIPVPPLEAQRKYADFCSTLEVQRLVLNRSSDGLEALFIAAQERAFAGKI